ncbi:MAG: tetratricopeptide repeat protein, partial [Rhodospirillales bacterium]
MSEAESLYERALVIREKVVGPGHPHVVQSLETYAGAICAAIWGAFRYEKLARLGQL